MVMQGSQMTLSRLWRLVEGSTQHRTSSLPLEGSLLFWVTLKFQVRRTVLRFYLETLITSVFSTAVVVAALI